ncbi:hypothetical protein IUQ79_20820 [Mycobacteroides abscessus subsp. bolletii]|uniref:phage terminase small subunit n=1 Tax=Mycobacteroides abscessus TaxID=36809 RepID=UPI0019D14DDF|nr:hypothetical protein [Mycobacteroides abscessus]MBN7304343.1 hypothetical protein [Mycobacteroides abscessus subsp. bolletii]
MAGRGRAPKDPSRRARRNSDPIPLRIVRVDPVAQPDLPEDYVWHSRTREWWRVWSQSPLSNEFTSTDWSELLDAALLHTAFWNGNAKVAGELRLRVAKFGATPEDRARLRIVFAEADRADPRPQRGGNGSTRRYLVD